MFPISRSQNAIPTGPGREVICEAFGGPRAGSEGSKMDGNVLKCLEDKVLPSKWQ